MPVTEVATLPLTHKLTESAPTLPQSLIERLHKAKVVVEAESGYPFQYFQEVEDPSIIYILGKWNSVAAHATFLPTRDNQELLELLKNDINTSGDRQMALWHLECDVFDFKADETSVLTAPVISLSRIFVSPTQKDAFENKFGEVRGLLEQYTKPYKVVGGWRIEKETAEGQEIREWELICGFKSIKMHMDFAETVEFKKFQEIVGFIQGSEVRHMKAINGL